MSLREMALVARDLWQKPRPSSGPATHDYATLRCAGHDYTFTPKDGGQRAHAMGWGRGIQNGDFLLLETVKNPDGKARYRVDTIAYFSDPPDMWSADLTFVPRQFCSDCRQEATDPHTCPPK